MANEKRLIDKDKLIENCDAPHWCVWMSEIEDFPEVDAVEVVHGQWLYDSGREHYFCSACNEEALHTSHDNPVYDYDWE